MRAALRDAVTLASRWGGGNWALARTASAFAWVAVVVAVSCDGGPPLRVGPTPLADPYFAAAFALVCIRDDQDRFEFMDGQDMDGQEDQPCTEDNIRRGLSSACALEYNMRFAHACTDGWADVGPGRRLSGDIRVRVSLSAFRAGRQFHTRRWEFDVSPNEAVWLCGRDGEGPIKDCKIMMTEDVLRSHASGTFELKKHWNACWLEYSLNGDGMECNPDPGYPDFPSATD